MIIGGSVGRGEAHEHSDVDAIAIITDDEYAHYRAAGVPPMSAAELAGEAGDDPWVGRWDKA